MSVIVRGGGKSSGLYVWGKYNADIGLGESINNIALANDGTSIDIYVKENLYIKEDGTIGVQGEPYSTVSISSVVEDTCIVGMTPTKYCIGVDGNVYASPLSHIAGSVDNCVANLVKVVKSTFIDFVVSDSESAYPDGAIHTDGYWYEKFDSSVLIPENIREGIDIWGVVGTLVEGVAGIDFGEVTISSNSVTSITVAHNLGVVPSWVALVPKVFSRISDTTNENVNGIALYHSRYGDTAFSTVTNTLTATEITFLADSRSYKFAAIDYYWFAIV